MAYKRVQSSITHLLAMLLFLFFLWAKPSYAQLSTTFNQHGLATNTVSPVKETLQIIAVMVEFTPDDNRFTSGNGTFGTGGLPYLDTPSVRIDPLPHNQAYFEAHLEFAKNYFDNASAGKLEVQYHVLPDIYRLNNEMAHYSPTGPNPDFRSLANFTADVWAEVESKGINGELPAIDEHTLFIIFHAGVGRDIELTGTSLDKTPEDIPSVYLSTNAFQRYFEDASFSGFPINNGNNIVTNTAILPRTLSRKGEDVSGASYVLQLSINGLLTAQIGSHIGLPDLFNTTTGASAIGRFGLMDGAGIFSYNGLFPPEMSAWEKIYLGWEEPFHIDINSQNTIYLPAVSLKEDKSIGRISLSNREYFLLENRHREPTNTGVDITIQKPDGTTVVQTFTNADEPFINLEQGYESLLEPGVVTNISNFDFSLPGGRDNDRDLNGGILIWHIDEQIIRQNIGSNSVNSDVDNRGVRLVEADGAQDIGRPISVGLFQNEANGSAFDFWWSGNNASVIIQQDTLQLYSNRFGPDTTPDNRSNSGALSPFELFDFSENLPVASVSIRPAELFPDLYTPLEVESGNSNPEISPFTPGDDYYWNNYPLAIQPYYKDEHNLAVVPGNNGIQIIDVTRRSLFTEIIPGAVQQPLVNTNTQNIIVAEHPNNHSDQIEISSVQVEHNSLTKTWTTSAEPNAGFISKSEEGTIDLDHGQSRILAWTGEVLSLDTNTQISEKRGEYQSKITNNLLTLSFPGGSSTFPVSRSNKFDKLHTGIIEQPNGDILFYLLDKYNISIFKPTDGYQQRHTVTKNNHIDWPAFVDFDADGSTDFLYVNYDTNQIVAKNINGAFLPGFPISLHGNSIFKGTPLVADVTGDENADLLIPVIDGFRMSILGYNQYTELLNGFPLDVGGIYSTEDMFIHPAFVHSTLIALSPVGDLKLWNFTNIGDVDWPAKYGPGSNNKVSGFINTGSDTLPQEKLLIASETYNWPNPAKNSTRIRYQTTEEAEVDIKIITLSGSLLYHKTFYTHGNLTEEIEIDTKTWASGAYFALVEATSVQQRKERKTIKIAITK